MLKQNILLSVIPCLVLLFIIIPNNAYGQESETIELEIKYTNGDRADFRGMSIIVYQDFDKSSILEKKIESNPDFITLPENHRYKIEVYAFGMYVDVAYIQSESISKKLTITIPLSGGLQLEIFYKGGEIPIDKARVVLKSRDNSELGQGLTNDQGETIRFWINPTNKQEDYYIADIYLADLFLTSYFPINIQPGITTDLKITTNIPEIVEELISINLYIGTKKITSADGDYKVTLSDLQGNDVVTSNVNFRGDAQFSNLKSGTYTVKISSDNEIEKYLWPQTDIHVIGDLNKFSVFKNYESIVKQDNLFQSCNCVAFRLDGVQDYWLNEVQIKIMETFIENKTPLTIGIHANAFGNDPKITEFVKLNVGDEGRYLEVATKGIELTPFTNYNKIQQNQNLKESLDLIESSVNVRPKVFIPPDNKFNSDTLEILEENNITHISSSLINGDLPPFDFEGKKFYRFPQITSTGKYNPSTNFFEAISSQQIISESIYGINNYGFSVISIQPQEFSIITNSTYVNSVNTQQIDELLKLIEGFNKKGYKIVPIGKINSNLIVLVPNWIKNNAGWWAEGSIDDETFVQGIEYLVKNGIIIY